MSDLPDNVDLQWLGRTLIDFRQIRAATFAPCAMTSASWPQSCAGLRTTKRLTVRNGAASLTPFAMCVTGSRRWKKSENLEHD